MERDLVLGLDSGGTKTDAALADRQGRVVARSRAAGLDPLAGTDWPDRLAGIIAALGVPQGRIAAAVLGLPCHGEGPDITAHQDRVAEALLPGRVLVQNDVRIAFDGAFAGGGGGLILAGTGSMAWASRGGADAPHLRAGGWGDLIGDEGSAFWIGQRALTRVARALDGREAASTFATAILAALGLPGADLIGWVGALGEGKRAIIAGLAREVALLAEAGDPVAEDLLDAAGDALAETLAAVLTRAGDATLPWSHAGSVLGNARIRGRITARLGRPPVPARLPPLGGALLGAARRAGWQPGPDWTLTLAANLA